MLGQVGLPGGGFAVGYGPVNLMGSAFPKYSGPTLPQGTNAVSDFIPVARFTRHAAAARRHGAVQRPRPRLSRHPAVYWAGGNPFHHHQDLNRLMLAWRKPETIVFHEQFWTPRRAWPTSCCRPPPAWSANDIGYGSRSPT